MIRIPLARPDLTGNEEKYVVDAIRSSWISSTGPYVERFEREFAALCETRSAISVSNGTVALHLALLTLDVKPEDEVIVPSLTYVATANAVRYVGATPVFVDVDPATWCVAPERIEAAITPRTRGIIAVHLYGHPADMDAIWEIARKHNLWVVEDAAEAPIARYKGRAVGSLATIATFSFYGNKVFTCGEGGALTLSDPDLESRARLLRGQGMDPNRRYYFPVIGHNFRLTNVACAMLCAQLERRDAIVRRRRQIQARYRAKLARSKVGLQPVAEWAEESPWLFNVTIDQKAFGLSSAGVMSELARRGIETRPFFIPVHTLPSFAGEHARGGQRLPVTELLAATGVSLPLYNGLTDDEVDDVIETLLGLSA